MFHFMCVKGFETAPEAALSVLKWPQKGRPGLWLARPTFSSRDKPESKRSKIFSRGPGRAGKLTSTAAIIISTNRMISDCPSFCDF
jgi:hypothetical protein